ncbi:tetratricopeptide repeat protein [Nonomuraea sp. NPDC050394]|uniref:tetratricopeptide repeat protein n=1 Tax=Nonomuraea sp. NPDC050394 TaxID=3364363 RepID=UPI0037B67751
MSTGAASLCRKSRRPAPTAPSWTPTPPTCGRPVSSSHLATHTAAHDLDAAGRDAERSLALFREEGDRWGLLQATHLLGSLAQISGDYERARALHRDALDVAEDLQLWPQVADSLAMLGRIALQTGSYAEADQYHERARRLAAEQLNTFTEQFAEVGLGLAARRAMGADAFAHAFARGRLEGAGAPIAALRDVARPRGS